MKVNYKTNISVYLYFTNKQLFDNIKDIILNLSIKKHYYYLNIKKI